MIASSPTDIQPVLDVVAENAARLCDAKDAVISRVDDNLYFRIVASYGSIPVPRELAQTSPISRGTPAGRAFSTGTRFMSMTSLQRSRQSSRILKLVSS